MLDVCIISRRVDGAGWHRCWHSRVDPLEKGLVTRNLGTPARWPWLLRIGLRREKKSLPPPQVTREGVYSPGDAQAVVLCCSLVSSSCLLANITCTCYKWESVQRNGSPRIPLISRMLHTWAIDDVVLWVLRCGGELILLHSGFRFFSFCLFLVIVMSCLWISVVLPLDDFFFVEKWASLNGEGGRGTKKRRGRGEGTSVSWWT